jgi:8-oxo-dGTP pyrophosphatase MutT (NUDIX family)
MSTWCHPSPVVEEQGEMDDVISNQPTTTSVTEDTDTTNTIINNNNSHDTVIDTTVHLSPEALETDHYQGITIRIARLPVAQQVPEAFAALLSHDLIAWRHHNKRGVWLQCPVAHAALVPIATQLGFVFHAVDAHSGDLILKTWLPVSEASRLPRGPLYQVGVGCFVLHPRDPTRMLVVQEQTGPAADYQLWKMPTGLADPGEDIPDAAVRELFEETGLKAHFQGIAVVRQAHPTRSLRAVSDLFFVCQLSLLPFGTTTTALQDENEDINVDDMWEVAHLTSTCPLEIAAMQWMSVDDYCAQARWQTSPVYQAMNRILQRLSQQLHSAESTLWYRHTLDLGFHMPGTNTLYTSLPPSHL